MEKIVYLKKSNQTHVEIFRFKGATEAEIRETLAKDFAGETNYVIKEKEVIPNQYQTLAIENGRLVLKDESPTEIRRLKITAIDRETATAIAAGFTYDGQRFSLSQNAQLNWQRLELLHQAGRFDESQTISTKDNSTYVLKAAKLTAFIQAGQAAIEAALAAGRAKKAALGGGLHAQL